MSILKKITTILFILCITGVSNAYPEAWGQINFSYISINDGLSQSTVFSIAQDKLGNMWFATYDGVNKYDGYTFTVYQHDENDPNSIAIDISRFQDPEEFKTTMDTYRSEVKGLKPAAGVEEIFMPGEIECNNYRKNLEAGPQLSLAVYRELEGLCEKLHIPFDILKK